MKNIIKSMAVGIICVGIIIGLTACGKEKTDDRPVVSISVVSSVEGEKLTGTNKPYGYQSVAVNYKTIRQGDTVEIIQPNKTNGITLDHIELDGETITGGTFTAAADCVLEYCYIRTVYNVVYQNGSGAAETRTIKVGEVPVNFETTVADQNEEREYGMAFDRSWNIPGITKRLTATTVLDAGDMLNIQFDGENLMVTPHYSSYVFGISNLRFDVSLGGTAAPSNYSVTNEQSTYTGGMYLYSKIATVGTNTIETVRTLASNVTPYYWALGTATQVTSPSSVATETVGDYTYYYFTGSLSGQNAVFAFISDGTYSISISFVGLDTEYMTIFFGTLQTI
jgi:hypothetical protein